jgi:hypothetical protein
MKLQFQELRSNMVILRISPGQYTVQQADHELSHHLVAYLLPLLVLVLASLRLRIEVSSYMISLIRIVIGI